ncbi:hypothetical protein K438DRAFT_2160319 [Mycena galopus ATCC 62051]|nr:hypothetical protein K438DRAFT_2160319 [Mycena galopus ATCC 62051]
MTASDFRDIILDLSTTNASEVDGRGAVLAVQNLKYLHWRDITVSLREKAPRETAQRLDCLDGEIARRIQEDELRCIVRKLMQFFRAQDVSEIVDLRRIELCEKDHDEESFSQPASQQAKKDNGGPRPLIHDRDQDELLVSSFLDPRAPGGRLVLRVPPFSNSISPPSSAVDLFGMSTPTTPLPSFSLIIHHAEASNVFVTMVWQPTSATTNTNATAAATPPPAPPSQPQPHPAVPAAFARRIYPILKVWVPFFLTASLFDYFGSNLG